MAWDDGEFPYDTLREAGVTPDSPMKEIRDAPFALIEQGAWSREKRAACDQLRTVNQRLWVDFLLYPLSAEETADALAGLFDGEDPLPNPEAALQPDFSELENLEREFEPRLQRAGASPWLPGGERKDAD
jgi:hypothetical protein